MISAQFACEANLRRHYADAPVRSLPAERLRNFACAMFFLWRFAHREDIMCVSLFATIIYLAGFA